MQSEDPNFTQDEALRTAIRRVWQGETAPASLRSRLERMYGLSEAQPVVRPSRWIIRRWVPLAAAALIILGLGWYGFQERNRAGHSAQVAALPATLAESLVATHDMCCSQPDHHMPGLPRDNYPLIASALQRLVGPPVLAAAPSGDWSFKGASLCMVGSAKSGHLVFKRPSQNLSIFSLSGTVLGSATTATLFEETYAGHPIAAFRSDGGLYCIVGSSVDNSLLPGTVDAIRNQLRPQLTASASARVTFASLK